MLRPISRPRVSVPRALILALGLFGLAAFTAAPAAAVEPIDAREPATLRRAPASEFDVDASVNLARATDPSAPGVDVSWPQCGATLPDAFGFAIVGVTGGRVYSANPCLGPGETESQLAWAGPEADLYMNTANPGPDLSEFWPHGQRASVDCDTPARPGADTSDCAFLYGWNAAADAYAAALEAFVALGWAEADADRLPGERTWWLDVETANTWRGDPALNTAALQGAVAYLESVDAVVGFYSTPLLWWRVTGGTDAFSAYPAWHAGATDQADALARCASETAFTGGELVMVQWIEGGFDRNVACP